ncbi:MAG TPA: TlpA disulfide reductase family protein [Ferruginibacter sp.]|nr:TlpA disulfide reductase family protein [Ferruginibacter sp.]
MNKKLFFLICFCFFICGLANAQQTKYVKLKGILLNFSSQVEVQDMSEFQYLLPPTSDRLIIPEPGFGDFEIKFPLSSPNYFRIGRNILYLTPGDDLDIVIDYNNPLIAEFKGKGSEANMFLRQTPFPKGGSYIEAGSKAQPTPQQTIDHIIQAGGYRKKQLDSVKNITAEFKRLETGRIRADIINSLLAGQISFYRPKAIRKDSVQMKIYGDEYAVLIQPYVKRYSNTFVDPSLMKLVVYRDLADTLVYQQGNLNDLQQIKDWIEATGQIDAMKKVSDKLLLAGFKTGIQNIKTAEYKNALNKSLAVLLKFGKGDIAVDFTTTDMNGKQVSLSSLKGKVIYVDLWATWCGPCMEEMPHYETLKEKYKNNPGIAFVSLSIDDNTTLWKASIEKRKATGHQWLINRNKLGAYNIVSIPRVLLIDKNFKVVDMNAPNPSSKKLPALLDELLR